MSCSGLLDEAKISVDTTLIDRAASSSPILAVALILGIVGLGFALRAAPPGHRAWSLLILFGPLGALFAWGGFQVHTELDFECIRRPAEIAGRLIAVSVGIGAVSFIQLCVTLSLRAWKRELSVLWPSVLLTTSLVIAVSVGWTKRTAQRDFARRVQVAMPVPNVRPAKTPPTAHVGHTLEFKPDVEAAARREGLFFPTRVWLSADDRRRWGIDTVTFTPEVEGLSPVPVHLQLDLVSVDAELEVNGVRDEGPSWFPLAKGNRWEFVAVRGRGGVLEKLRASIERGKKPIPEATITLEVTNEGERNGFHFFEVTETRKGGLVKTREVVRRDGDLFADGERVASLERGSCRISLLEPSWCTCVNDRLTHCSVVSGDIGESLLRLFLGAVTLGISELQGMGDLGAGNEAGLLLTRWTIGEQQAALFPRQKKP